MSGLIANAPAPAAQKVTAGGWYPDIDIDDLRKVVSTDGTITNERLNECTVNALNYVMDALDEWQQQQVLLGRNSLADVPARQLNGESSLVMLFRRAVYSNVKAELVERYRDFDSTDAGQRRAEQMDLTVDDYRRNARFAISDILGRRRITAELL